VKATRRILAIVLVLGLAFVVASACQTIDGACWLPDSQGQGGGAGGPIIPTGAGGYGDTPPGDGGYGAGYVPCPQQQPTEVSQWICPMPGTKECTEQCDAKEGVFCAARASTSQHPEYGEGFLYGCCGCQGTAHCKYWFLVNGGVRRCKRYYPSGQWLCSIDGGG